MFGCRRRSGARTAGSRDDGPGYRGRIDAPPSTPDRSDDAPAGPSLGLVIGAGCLLIGLALVVVSLVRSNSGDPSDASVTTTAVIPVEAPGIEAGTTAPLGSAGLGEGVAKEVSGRTPLRGFGEVQVSLTTQEGKICELCLLSAATQEQRARGLMEVTDEDLGGYDGMLFEYPDPVDGEFWMKNTPLPLSIAYFDAQGRLVSTSDMEPCGNDPTCPTYPAADSFEYAIEVPQGLLDEIGATPGATLHIHTRHCPLAEGGG
jgi:uncharacterized membrane protein (UPF0127 family)